MQVMALGHPMWVGGLQKGPSELGLDVRWGFNREGWGWGGGVRRHQVREEEEAGKARQGLVWGHSVGDGAPTKQPQGMG